MRHILKVQFIFSELTEILCITGFGDKISEMANLFNKTHSRVVWEDAFHQVQFVRVVHINSI